MMLHYVDGPAEGRRERVTEDEWSEYRILVTLDGAMLKYRRIWDGEKPTTRYELDKGEQR